MLGFYQAGSLAAFQTPLLNLLKIDSPTLASQVWRGRLVQTSQKGLRPAGWQPGWAHPQIWRISSRYVGLSSDTILLAELCSSIVSLNQKNSKFGFVVSNSAWCNMYLSFVENKGVNSTRLVACITTLYLFSKIRAQLMVKHAMTMQPYLTTKCNVSTVSLNQFCWSMIFKDKKPSKISTLCCPEKVCSIFLFDL